MVGDRQVGTASCLAAWLVDPVNFAAFRIWIKRHELIFEYGVFIIFSNQQLTLETLYQQVVQRGREKEREYKVVGWHGGSEVQFGFGKVADTVGYCRCRV